MYKAISKYLVAIFAFLVSSIIADEVTQERQELPISLNDHKYPSVYISLLQFMEQLVRTHTISIKTDRNQLVTYLQSSDFKWSGDEQEYTELQEKYGYKEEKHLIDGSKLIADFVLYEESLWNDETTSKSILGSSFFDNKENTYLAAYLKLITTYQTQRRYPLILLDTEVNHNTYGKYQKKILSEGFIRQSKVNLPYRIIYKIQDNIKTPTKFNLIYAPIELLTTGKKRFQVLERRDTFLRISELDYPPYNRKTVEKIFEEAYPELKKKQKIYNTTVTSWITGKSINNAHSMFFGLYAHHINPTPKLHRKGNYNWIKDPIIPKDYSFKKNGIYKFSVGIWKTQTPEKFDDYSVRDLGWVHNINIFLDQTDQGTNTLSSEPYMIYLNDTYYVLINNRRQYKRCDLYLLSNNSKPIPISSFSSPDHYRFMQSSVSGNNLYTFNTTLEGGIFYDYFNFSEQHSKTYRKRGWLYQPKNFYARKVNHIYIPLNSKKLFFTSNQTGANYIDLVSSQSNQLLKNKGPFDALVASNDCLITHRQHTQFLYAGEVRQQEKILKSNALATYEEFKNCEWKLHIANNPHYLLVQATPKQPSESLYKNILAFNKNSYGTQDTSFIAIIDFRRPDKPLYAYRHTSTPFFCPKTGVLINNIGTYFDTTHFKFI